MKLIAFILFVLVAAHFFVALVNNFIYGPWNQITSPQWHQRWITFYWRSE